MATVVGEDDVSLGLQVVDHPDGVRLLPDVRVRRPVELALREEVEERLLEPADEEHALVQRSQRSRGHRYPRSASRCVTIASSSSVSSRRSADSSSW